MAARALLVDFLLAGVEDLSGNPLAAGKVYAYDAGGLVARSLWTGPTKAVLTATPVVLDGQGMAQVYGDGAYRFIIKTASNVQLYDIDNVDLYSTVDVSNYYGATSGGSANSQTVTISTFPTAYANGQTIIFRTGFAVTGPATLNVNGLGAIAIIQDISGNALANGDLPANSLVRVTYFGGNFVLQGTANDAYATKFTGTSFVGTTFTATNSVLSNNSMQSSGGTFSVGTTDTSSTQFTNNSLARWSLDSSGNFNQNATNGNNIVFSKAATGIANTVSAAVTAAGSNLATATQLTAAINYITTVTASTGVKLPDMPVGGMCVVHNASATTLTVYAPDASQDIRRSTVGYGSGGMSLASGFPAAMYFKISTTLWFVILTG